MGDFLYARFLCKENQVNVSYWWELIFQAMHQADFQFNHPQNAENLGEYAWEETDWATENISFQELWRIISQQSSMPGPLVSFWFENKEPPLFQVQISVEERKENVWCIDITVTSGYFPESSITRLHAFFHACWKFYELCLPPNPDAFNLFWEKEQLVALAHVISSQQEESLLPLIVDEKVLSWKRQVCIQPHNRCIYIPEPFPLYRNLMPRRYVAL